MCLCYANVYKTHIWPRDPHSGVTNLCDNESKRKIAIEDNNIMCNDLILHINWLMNVKSFV